MRGWLLWVVVVERERCLWRHRYHAEIASDHAYDYLDCALTLRVDAYLTCRVLEVHVRSLALECSIKQQGRVIDEWRCQSGSFAFAGQPAVDHPAAFRWHASSKRNRAGWCLFPFRMATVLPLRTAWMANILSQASLHDVQRQRCWKRGTCSGDSGPLSRVQGSQAYICMQTVLFLWQRLFCAAPGRHLCTKIAAAPRITIRSRTTRMRKDMPGRCCYG